MTAQRRPDDCESLAALHRTEGTPPGRDPASWAKGDGADFVAHIERTRGIGLDFASAEVWGHWQIAMAYAQWLSPRLAIEQQRLFVEAVKTPVWSAIALGRALGYGTEGRAILALCRGPWRDELGSNAFDGQDGDLWLSEAGFYLVLLLCRKPAGRRMRDAFASNPKEIPSIIDEVIRAIEQGCILFGGRCP